MPTCGIGPHAETDYGSAVHLCERTFGARLLIVDDEPAILRAFGTFAAGSARSRRRFGWAKRP